MRIESLLSARSFLAPQRVGNNLYFISNLSGRLSLYVMPLSGGVPQPLLPPHIALQNPHLMSSYAFRVLPALGKILIMLDDNGDENYQPMLIPLEGGFPEPIFAETFANMRVHLGEVDTDHHLAYFSAESRAESLNAVYRANLQTGEILQICQSPWGAYLATHTPDHQHLLIGEGYTAGDSVLYEWRADAPELRLFFGTPLHLRPADYAEPPNGLQSVHFTHSGSGLLLSLAVFEDTYGPAYLPLHEANATLQRVSIQGLQHTGMGEMEGIHHLRDERYTLHYNIDGCSWVYQARFDEPNRTLIVEYVLCGQGALANGVLESFDYDKATDSFAISFSSATSPTQLYTLQGAARDQLTQHTQERVLGIDPNLLSPGEDASFTSFDGLRISARLYMPSEKLGYQGARPLVYYIHGGPQSQERPDFAWFSMPLIQFLTLNGFAVFVPNVRGSSGYGLGYMKQVDRDWGGKDRLDHVHALTQVLAKDPRIDTQRTAVVGRSYGGYMTLTLAFRHPELWRAACDMFGPYDLFTFMERLPETWKPYFYQSVGHPEKDRDFLIERSPKTYRDQLSAPMLVIQGKNDPRVIERESRDVVEYLQSTGKHIEYLMFENEGHDVLKYENRVTCYNAITNFFKTHLGS